MEKNAVEHLSHLHARLSIDPVATEANCTSDPNNVCSDMTIDLSGTSFRTYIKIADATEGNTARGGFVAAGKLGGKGVVDSMGGQICLSQFPIFTGWRSRPITSKM